jgi:pyruvate kinase
VASSNLLIIYQGGNIARQSFLPFPIIHYLYINMRKTQIVCTIGPASWDQAVFQKMAEAGMNVARVNGAFADTAELDKVTALARNVQGYKVELMMDVKGPEVRMNKFSAPIPLTAGQEIIIGSTAEAQIYPANYPNVYESLAAGQRIVVGDGDVELKVKEIKDGNMICEVVYGEELKPGKALNLPGATFTSDTLTAKDLENLNHSLKLGWEYVSASFVQSAEGARKVKEVIGNNPMKLVAKIEDQQGVDNIDEILEVVDGIMIARGGLGVELGLEKVPMVQRHLIERARAHGKPSITATQMLESMLTNSRPTRAEVNDVVTAVLLGTDAVMLSGESSAGKHPIEAVKWMAKAVDEVEGLAGKEVLQA